MVNNVDKLFDCYIKNCKKELDIYKKQIGDKIRKKSDKLYSDYEKGKISQKEFIKKATKNNEKLLNSYESISYHKCEINKCYKYVKKNLDKYADKINYKKKTNYSVKDYIKIFQLVFRKNIKNIKL
jgi:hypothetical protein